MCLDHASARRVWPEGSMWQVRHCESDAFERAPVQLLSSRSSLPLRLLSMLEPADVIIVQINSMMFFYLTGEPAASCHAALSGHILLLLVPILVVFVTSLCNDYGSPCVSSSRSTTASRISSWTSQGIVSTVSSLGFRLDLFPDLELERSALQ